MLLTKSDITRFYTKISIGNNCWEWKGYLNRRYKGYGRIKINGRTEQAHRVMWTLVYGEIPEGMVVCHKCDNSICVRPDHLFIGTQYDNVQDAISKGRDNCTRGEGHYRSKLSRNKVLAIRKDYSSLDRDKYQVQEFVDWCAQKYEVKFETIEAVIYGKTWKHIH